MDGQQEDGSGHDRETQKKGCYPLHSFHKCIWCPPPCQTLEPIEQDTHDPYLHELSTLVREADGKPLKAQIHQRIAGRVKCFEGDKQGKRGEPSFVEWLRRAL